MIEQVPEQRTGETAEEMMARTQPLADRAKRDDLLIVEFFDGKRWVLQLAEPEGHNVYVYDNVLNVYGSRSMALLGAKLDPPTWHYFPLGNVRTWERKPV